MPRTSTVRIQLNVTPEVHTLLRGVCQLQGVTTTELFRRALFSYNLLVEAQRGGSKVIIEDAKGERETVRFV